MGKRRSWPAAQGFARRGIPDLRTDPDPGSKVVDHLAYAIVENALVSRLTTELLTSENLRVLEQDDAFDNTPYYHVRPGRVD